MSKSQCFDILMWLRSNGSITPIQAIDEFGCLRLAARVNELRSMGHDIASEKMRTRNGKYVAKYHLVRAAA